MKFFICAGRNFLGGDGGRQLRKEQEKERE